MSVLCVITSSHRQSARLPDGRIDSCLNGVSRSLGTKDRTWYYLDTPENRERLKAFRIHRKLSQEASERLAKRLQDAQERWQHHF